VSSVERSIQQIIDRFENTRVEKIGQAALCLLCTNCSH